MPDIEQGVVADQRGVRMPARNPSKLGEHGGDIGLAGEVGGADAVLGIAVLRAVTPGLASWWKVSRRVPLSSTTALTEIGWKAASAVLVAFVCVVSMSRMSNSRPATSSW